MRCEEEVDEQSIEEKKREIAEEVRLITSWVVQARGPANVRSLPFNFSFRMAINVKRAIS